MIEFAIAEFARDRFMQGERQRSGGQSVSADLQSIAAYAEQSSGRLAAQPGGARQIACKKGCNYCCHMRVVASVPEVMALAEFIVTNFTPIARTALSRRVAETDAMTHGLSDEQWGLAGHPCPLLVDGQCSAYAARPLECRGYNSTQVESCQAAAEDYLEWNVPMDQNLMAAFKNAQAGLLQALIGKGRRPRLVEVTAALRIILEDPTAADRWFNGEPAFAEAELDPSDPEQRAFLPWVPSDELRAAAELDDLP